MSQPWKGAAVPLTAADYANTAAALNVSVPVIKAVFEVESSGRSFRSDGSVERRFEPHHFPKASWGALGFKPAKGEAPWRASLKVKFAAREAMFAKAYSIDPESAMAATSWGGPQIMGFNAAASGFPTARAMVEAMAAREGAHLSAFAGFVRSKGLVAALRAHDWLAFATVYNGNGQAASYAKKMEAAYRRHAGKASAEVLSLGSSGEAVKVLQRALGLDADGGFGPKTRAAVIAFQKSRGLSADGVVGDKTWDAIRAQQPDVKPVAQRTNADVVAKVTAYSSAATAAAGAAASIGDALPETAMNLLVGGGVAAGILALGAFLFVRVRERVA